MSGSLALASNSLNTASLAQSKVPVLPVLASRLPLPRSNRVRLGALLLACATLPACSGSEDDAARGPRETEVGYIVAKPSTVPISVSLSGRTVAFETSQVRPQVEGVIRKRLFTEGAYVKAGQTLYQIDPSIYRAQVNQANANLASARASAAAAKARAERLKPLAEMEAVAKQDYTDALADARVAEASIAQNKAALETAQVNLRFTTVPAPISGRIGRSLVTVGALASASQADPLAIIQRTDPIYVDLNQSAADLVGLRRRLARGGATPGSTEVTLHLDDGTEYEQRGTVKFSEVTVDEDTGTVTLRAQFPNPDGLLLPGMFVTASFDQARAPGAFLVPQAAVQRDFDGSAYLMVVGKDGKAERRKVTSDRTLGPNSVVTAGLKDGDKVITEGLNGLKQDAAIKPVPAGSASPAAGAKAASAKKDG
ncbi:efflux RND transporter periplasmic adaptor subunit [Novosphingobium sp. YJ-S2-02]|uniref:Efflux RND transporter periplasmic adaptor subunit n=1 Tax=Novosphingobium aureum TaxID=2792964 RepID=A0A931HCW9_9SPHN|nr:efflux RND transporter periplasmic adaptor subunit [Novosphingobium aureum]